MNPELIDFICPTNSAQLATFVKQDRHDTYPFIAPKGGELSGKTILITGASRGIGLAIAISCAKAGAKRIAIAARSSLDEAIRQIQAAAKESSTEIPEILPLQVDVTSNDSVKEAATRFKSEFGEVLDVLVNNAGYLARYERIAEAQPDNWWTGYEVNVKGTFLCAHHFLPFVLQSETKIVINMSSIGAHTITPGGSSYGSSRFANCRLTEFMAHDYEKEGLIAISVHPGGISTDMGEDLPQQMLPLLCDKIALPADTTLWLASERRDWLNGRYVTSNWDLEELESKKSEIVEKDLFKFRVTI